MICSIVAKNMVVSRSINGRVSPRSVVEPVRRRTNRTSIKGLFSEKYDLGLITINFGIEYTQAKKTTIMANTRAIATKPKGGSSTCTLPSIGMTIQITK
jgi:hypothetical protein